MNPNKPVRSLARQTLEALCVALAFIGVGLFITEASISVASILGRLFLSQGVPGDYEVVSILSAIGIALCLPYCELKRGHVFVDFFTLWAPQVLRNALDTVAALALALVSFFLAWRTWDGMLEMLEYGESTMILNWPVWWAYLPLLPALVLLGCAALYNLFSPATERLPHD